MTERRELSLPLGATKALNGAECVTFQTLLCVAQKFGMILFALVLTVGCDEFSSKEERLKSLRFERINACMDAARSFVGSSVYVDFSTTEWGAKHNHDYSSIGAVSRTFSVKDASGAEHRYIIHCSFGDGVYLRDMQVLKMN